MRVLITGLPLFGERLAKDLQDFDPDSRYTALNTYYSKWDKVKFLLLLPFADLVISLNGVTDRSGSLNWVLRFRKKMLMQWNGTDALLAIERNANQTIDRKYIDYAVHFTDNPWMKEEIESVGVSVGLLEFKYVSNPEEGIVEQYDGIRVASYVAQKRQEYYGLKKICILAQEFPAIPFDIYGMDFPDFECPPNVAFHGWVSAAEMAMAMKRSAIFLRLPEHDGFSVSVIEALGYGCEVIWTMPCEYTSSVKNDGELMTVFKQLHEKITMRKLTPNLENSAWAIRCYNREKVIKNYLQILYRIGK